MGRAGILVLAVVLLACGKKDNPHKKMRLVDNLVVDALVLEHQAHRLARV